MFQVNFPFFRFLVNFWLLFIQNSKVGRKPKVTHARIEACVLSENINIDLEREMNRNEPERVVILCMTLTLINFIYSPFVFFLDLIILFCCCFLQKK